MTFDDIFPSEMPIIFLHAHPDDESFLTAGLIRQAIETGRRCLLIYAAAACVPDAERTMTRQSEAYAACSVLGVEEIFFLPFCEPKYENKINKPLVSQTPQSVANSLNSLLRKIGINCAVSLVSYDENGGYGNRDHKALYKATCYLRKNVPLPTGSRYLTATIDRNQMKTWLTNAKLRLPINSLPDLSYWSAKFGLPTSRIAFQYTLTDNQVRLKKIAMTAHRSQMPKDVFPLCIDDKDYLAVFGTEHIAI